LFRNAITLAHQCQITQLKDNFKEKYRLNEEWPEKLANELNKEREKSKQELLRQEAKLQENFKMVCLFFCDYTINVPIFGMTQNLKYKIRFLKNKKNSKEFKKLLEKQLFFKIILNHN
jgi:hypothetical protein